MNFLDLGAQFGMSVRNIFDNYPEFNEVVSFDAADIICFGGGSDISPRLYRHQNVASGGINQRRDFIEVEEYQKAIKKGKILLGVCRGAQLITAMQPGGWLIQHVDGHGGGDHYIYTQDSQILITTSCHHQMMYPWNISNFILDAWHPGNDHYNRYVQWDQQSVPDVEEVLYNLQEHPEIVIYPDVRALCVQGHPEWSDDKPFLDYLVNKLKGL